MAAGGGVPRLAWGSQPGRGPAAAAESAGPGPPPGHVAGRAAAGSMEDGGSPGEPPPLFSCVMP